MSEHDCLVCQRRPYLRAFVCDPDRGRLPHILADIVHLHAQLPEALQRPQGNGQKVSGSREAPVPISLDVVDLSAIARNGTVHDLHGDQVGHIAVASVLDQWVRWWRDSTPMRQTLPIPTVPELARWLTNRLDWACDNHAAIGDFNTEMIRQRGILRAILGLNDPAPDFCDGVVCRSCDHMALYRDGQYVECDQCGLLYTEDEYHEWVGLLAGQARTLAA